MPGPSKAQQNGERAPERERVSAHVEPELALAFRRLAAERHVSCGAVIADAMRTYLELEATRTEAGR